MTPDVKKRLEAAGWKVGSVQEFLGLSDEEVALIELKLDLSRAIKARRIARKLTQQHLAKLLGSSQSRVAKMEAGDRSVSIDLLIRTLLKMGTSRRDLVRYLGPPAGRRAA
jgi:DNA-binding XRE family transcriptional regulator